uniref:Nck-associated protein 5 C-terminal domain-containing protein n=2 Tax=Echeneis naucrates TaxID=173247 RepID=A0A665WJS3_ECHNA
MEETVRTLLQNQDSLEGTKVDPLDLMKAYKDKLLEEMWKQQDSLEGPMAAAAEMTTPEASGGSEENSQDSYPLLERLRALEAENSALSMENDNQRKQYERCLDEVANQVVQALLTQKDLKEECVKLRTRVFDLEQQNRILSVLFQQRVKMSSIPISQEAQRNGKAGFSAGRWPSLLSLTCPRSSGSGSGSELSLSSACSEYSSGSHTWAEGRGHSKQGATSRDKRMSACSVSSNHSAHIDQADLGWKEGHILKGLKRLQTGSSKEASSHASVPHCKDCMTSNEGIYSLGGLQGATAKQTNLTSKPFKAKEAIAALDSDDADDDSSKLQSRESGEHPKKEHLCLEKLEASRDDDGNFLEDPVKLAGDSGLFPSPVTDNFLFLEGPTVKPGVSPTDTLIPQQEKKKDSLEKQNASGVKFNDRNNNQERSTDRKSRLDHVKRQQVRLTIKQMEAGTGDISSSIPHRATRALTCVNEARQRSSSAEVPHCRDQASQAGGHTRHYTISESPQRKLKPRPCVSARKAFILRSKSADGGPEQVKATHSPLHQKLIKGHRSQGQSNPAGHSVPSQRTNLSKTHCSSKGALSKVEKDEDVTIATSSKSLECVQQHSPLASPVKYSKTLKPQGVNECSKTPTKSSLQIHSPQSSSDSVEESIYDNLPYSPRKQQHCNASYSEPMSPPPPPPGRTTSLLLKPGCDSLSEANKSAGLAQSSTTGKTTLNTTKSQSHQFSSQQFSTTKDNQHTAPQMGADGTPLKEIPAKLYHSHSSMISHAPVQESTQLSVDRAAICHVENDAPSVLPSQRILQRSQQSISEPKLSEVLPQAYSNVYYHGISNSSQSSTSRALKMALPVNAKSNEAITGQETTTFLIFGRQNKDDANSTIKTVQTFQTFSRDPQVTHEGGPHDKARRKIETRCNSLDSEPSMQPVASDSGVMLDWGFDEEGWLFKRSVSVSTRPLLKPVMGMNGAKARSQSFGARYMDRPSFNRSGRVRTQIKTHSGSSLNSLGDVLPGSMSCSSSYHCPMNRSLLNNFLIEEGLTVPSHLGSSSERLQSLKLQREQARRLQIEQQFSSAFGEPVSEEPERQSTITTIEEKVMLGIEENLHKSQEERRVEVKQKSGSTLANWFGFRKSKLPAPNGKKTDPPKVKEDKREQKITSLLGGKQSKSDKKRDRRKSDGKDCSVGRRESHDAVRACISMPCPGMSLNEIQGHTDISGDPKKQMMGRRPDGENGSTMKSPNQDGGIGSGCKMRTLDSGIGTIPLPESCSFFSSILHLLPKSSSTPEQSLSPPSVPGSSSEDVSPSPLPRWRIPSGFKDSSHAGVKNSLHDSSMTHIQSVPFPTVAFLQPIQSQSEPIVTSASVCDTQSRLPRPPPGGMEPKRLTYIKSKTRATPSQQKEQTRLQLAN